MNCPRYFFARAITVRRGGIDHQQLILGYLVPASGDFAPAIAFRAINENHFRAAVISHTSVAFGFWIIACVRRQQMPEQRLLQSRGQNRSWHHNQTLSGKAILFLTPLHARGFFNSTIMALLESRQSSLQGFKMI